MVLYVNNISAFYSDCVENLTAFTEENFSSKDNNLFGKEARIFMKNFSIYTNRILSWFSFW